MAADTVVNDSDETPPHAPAPTRRRHRTRVRLGGVLCGVLLVAAGATLVTQLHHHPKTAVVTKVPVSWQRPVVSAAGLAVRSGVQITYVAVTGGGGLVDLRFKVLDADLAAELHDADKPAAVVEEKTGLVVHDLLMSHSHTGPFKTGISYYLLFNNPGNWIRRGSEVTVLLGDAAVEHVVVQ